MGKVSVYNCLRRCGGIGASMLHLQLAGSSVDPRTITSLEIPAGVEPPPLFPRAVLLELAGLADAFREVSENRFRESEPREPEIVQPKV